ncbi:MAG: YihY/virulence factor BrkB family protein [Chloroflexales bacterium]|nr:YihY/virulence factor BrkB family protein [Chloroflexales bacterium]
MTTIDTMGRATRRRLRRLGERLQEALIAFRADRAQILSAALVYYGMLSVVPLLVMLAAIPGLLLRFSEAPRAAGNILAFAEAAFGPEFRALVERSLDDLQRDSLSASLVAFGALLVGASLVFRHISRCFRFIWRGAEPSETLGAVMRQSLLVKVLDRVVGFAMVLAVGIALLLATVASALIQLLQRALSVLPWLEELTGWAIAPATSLGLSLALFLLLFKFLPPVKINWRDVWGPALLCTVGWQVAKEGLLLYIAIVGRSSSYGALSVLMALLFWFYANGMILFFCAELCKVSTQARVEMR